MTATLNDTIPFPSLFVTNARILRGEQDRAVGGFYAFLLRPSAPLEDPRGIDDAAPGGAALFPLWAAALGVITLRNMIIREEDETLHLFSAVPPAWLEPGKAVVFENAPTRFGKISVSVEAGQDSVFVRFTRPERSDPARVLVHLPPDLEITGIGRCGREIRVSGVREVLIPGNELTDENDLELAVRRTPGGPHRDSASRAARPDAVY